MAKCCLSQRKIAWSMIRFLALSIYTSNLEQGHLWLAHLMNVQMRPLFSLWLQDSCWHCWTKAFTKPIIWMSSCKFFKRECNFDPFSQQILFCREPEALPFCALAYALIGIISTILVSIPFIRSALIALAGWLLEDSAAGQHISIA